MSDEDVEIAVNQNDITWMKGMLIEIKAETKKTNGRVTKLELWKAWSVGIIIGATAVFSFIAHGIKALLGF